MPCAILACLLLVAGGSTLPDESSVVATDVGLYLVKKGQVAQAVFTPADLGLSAFVEPSVTWLAGTDTFILTSRGDAFTGRIWRIHVSAAGVGSATNLTPSVPDALGRDFADADYAIGLDTLFVLCRNEGLLWAWKAPASSAADTAVTWAAFTPGEPVSLAVNGATSPFGIVVSQRTEPVLRVTKAGASVLSASFTPPQVACNGATGEWYAADPATGFVGVPSGGAGINFNATGFCGAPAKQPVDVAWDAVARRAVALGGDGAGCIDGAAPTGPNHVVRLPLTAGGGPPNNKPVLLTFAGGSGIDGADGDLAYVRHGGGDLTWFGAAGVSGAALSPSMDAAAATYGGAAAIDKPWTLSASDAPPSATAYLVIGFLPLSLPVQGQLLVPWPQFLIPAASDGAGDVALTLPIPAAAELVGKLLYAQWWFDDTTTPAGGDVVSTQTAICAIGVK